LYTLHEAVISLLKAGKIQKKPVECHLEHYRREKIQLLWVGLFLQLSYNPPGKAAVFPAVYPNCYILNANGI
jgi:hypothetical protein